MDKIAVIYATKTKHSKKLARAIGTALKVESKNITDNPSLQNIDLVFIVGGIYGGVSLPELLEYVRKIEYLPKYAAIVTSCASGEQKQTEVRSILEEKGIKVIDEFVCRGGFMFFFINHPNAKDLEDSIYFAEKIVNTVS